MAAAAAAAAAGESDSASPSEQPVEMDAEAATTTSAAFASASETLGSTTCGVSSIYQSLLPEMSVGGASMLATTTVALATVVRFATFAVNVLG